MNTAGHSQTTAFSCFSPKSVHFFPLVLVHMQFTMGRKKKMRQHENYKIICNCANATLFCYYMWPIVNWWSAKLTLTLFRKCYVLYKQLYISFQDIYHVLYIFFKLYDVCVVCVCVCVCVCVWLWVCAHTCVWVCVMKWVYPCIFVSALTVWAP